MSDPMVPSHDVIPEPVAGMHMDRRLHDGDTVHRWTARLATLDLDPATLEILTAVLNADVDLRSGFARDAEEECSPAG